MRSNITPVSYTLDGYIEQIIAHTKASELPQSFKAQAVLALTYFLNQARCHADRRDPPHIVRENWIDLDTLFLGTSILDKFKTDKHNWEALQEGLGIIPLRPPPPPKPKALKKRRFEGRNIEELLAHLAREVENCRSFSSEGEKNFVCLGVFYLELEARRGRAQRNHDRIAFVWRLTQPSLRRAGLLTELFDDPEVLRKFKFFILNKMV